MSIDPMSGAELEARALRLYLAQGSFAERGLLPTATPDRRMLATDIDVLVSEYTSGFHLTRRHVECKTGKFPLLDRILWLNGVRSLLRADSSYLLAANIDFGASAFARSLDVELFSLQHLEGWERSLGISSDIWPCRSDYLTFDKARARWADIGGRGNTDDVWRLLREASAFVEVESWLTFRYRLLNKLLRIFSELSKKWPNCTGDRDKELCARYVFGALLVRLSQYLLAICADVASVLPTELERVLSQRLVFGDQDSSQADALVRQTATWIAKALSARGIELPAEIDAGRLSTPPPYAGDFVELVRKVLNSSHESRYLPLAMERLQFGDESDDKLPRFRAAAQFADTLAAHVRAFIIRAFSVPEHLVRPLHADLTATYRSSQPSVSKGDHEAPPRRSPQQRPLAGVPRRRTR